MCLPYTITTDNLIIVLSPPRPVPHRPGKWGLTVSLAPSQEMSHVETFKMQAHVKRAGLLYRERMLEAMSNCRVISNHIPPTVQLLQKQLHHHAV